MKKTKLLLLIVALLSCMLMAFASCKTEETEKEVTVQLNHQTYSLDLHEEIQLIATTENTESSVTWASSAPSVATVDDNGLVKSVKGGKSTITASVEGKQATCEITVTNSGTAPVLEVSNDNIGVNKDAEITVNASVKYKGNTVTESVNVSWAISQGEPDNVVSVTPASGGKSAVIKGLEYGETKIDVTTVMWGTPLKRTVAVKVCNTDISFEVTGYELCAGGYEASLALVETEDYSTTTTLAITVKNKGVVVSDAQIEWTPDVQDIVSVESGVITAQKEGEVVLTGSYSNNTVKLFINVIRPQITLSEITLETSKAQLTLAEDDEIAGTISSVKFDGETNVYDKTQEGKIILKADLLPKAATELGEGKTIVVETEKATYSIPANIYTQVIRTKNDLATWGTLAKAAHSNAKIWDGYFVLGNDIDFEGETYNSFINWSKTETLACTEAGFKGVFDGKGHIIDDIVIDPSYGGGFVGMLYTSDGGAEFGVIRNVAFTNAVSEGKGGFVVSCGGGLVSNVYVSLNMLKGGENNDRSGVFFTRDAQGWAARVSNCFVEIKGIETTENTYAIGSKHRRTGMIQNVYAVGYDNAFFELSDATWDNPVDVYGAYKGYSELLDADIDFSGWDTDFWKTVKGIPYPKALDESKIPEIVTANLTATVTATNAISPFVTVDVKGKTVKLEGLYGKYEAVVGSDGKINIANVVKGNYNISIDSSFAMASAEFNGQALAVSLVYTGKQLNVPITTENHDFYGAQVPVSKGEMDITEKLGQYQAKLGSNRQNHVISKQEYDNVSVSAMFKESYGAYANTMGIMLKFDDGKGILLGFQDDNGTKLTYRTDNEGYKFGMADTLTGWIGDNGELKDCKPLKDEWLNKLKSNAGVKVTLVRNGNVLLTYVEDTLVNVYALSEEYASKKCQIGFFSNWGACDIPFAVTDEFTRADANITVSGLNGLANGTATLNAQSYKVGDKIVLNLAPADGYKATSVKVNGVDKTTLLTENGTKLVLGYADGDATFAFEITFDAPTTLNATVTGLKSGNNVDLTGKTITLEGVAGTFTGTVGTNGALSVENAYKGTYTAKLDGYIDCNVTFENSNAVTINFEYDLFEGSGGYNLADQNKTDASVFIGKQQHNYVLTKDKYDDVSMTATFKKSYGSYKGFMGMQIVFDDGNGVMIVFECTNVDGAIHENEMKLCFGTDCWGAKYAITGNALVGWTDLKNPLTEEQATAFAGEGLTITVVREDNKITVKQGDVELGSTTIDEKYTNEKCRISLYTEWGEAEIPFSINENI